MDDVVANLERRMADMMVQLNAVQAREAAVVAELRALQAAAAPVPAGRGADDDIGGRLGGHEARTMIDTRTLGKPDIYTGDENKWQDWKVVVKAYCSVVNPRMGNLMAHAEDTQTQALDSMLDERDRATSQQLY